MLIDSLLSLITEASPSIIMGDFNLDPTKDSKEYSKLNTALISLGFKQIINRATHIKGNILDHMYVLDVGEFSWQLHHPYWSDHDATCLQANLQ